MSTIVSFAFIRFGAATGQPARWLKAGTSGQPTSISNGLTPLTTLEFSLSFYPIKLTKPYQTFYNPNIK